MTPFTHLHVHTHYSLLDGAASIKNLVAKAKEDGMTSLAVTDHGNLFGAYEFYKEASANGIKPIIGCEVYVAEGSRFLKQGRQDRSGYHLILLAKNLEGYYNLCRLVSLGFLEGFYYTPRIDKELLKQYSGGLIACSACIGGEIPNNILHKGEEKGEEVLKEYLDIFGDNLYLELQRHGLAEQDKVNPVLMRLADKYGIKYIATNDVHFTNAADYEAHKILICLNTGKDLENSSDDLHYSGQEFLKTQSEMNALFHDIPEALENTQHLIDRVEKYSIEQEILLPEFPLPEGFETGDDYLQHLTYSGAKKYYPALTDEIRERLDFELSVIKKMGYAGYFLIVQDFINEARRMGVLVGPGRGSAAGSAVAFCTGITSIDPIKYNLLFERFLNPERISMPDIDIDFDDEGRDRVIQYVVNKYGEKRVAQIVTFGTMAARSSIRDVARVLKLPLSQADYLAKLVPPNPGTTLKSAYSDVKELDDQRKKGDELTKKTLEFAQTLEGCARHTGTHACGVIIGKEDLIGLVPLSTSKETDMMVSQYEGKYIEKVGLLKMDFLGLKTLSIIKDSLVNIKRKHGIDLDLEDISLEDPLTYELFQRGDTVGIFQFESDGMRNYLKRLKPTNIEDLIAMNALFRPGPMEQIPTYISRKHGKERVEYPHHLLEDILRPTQGILIYQEQIMQTAQILGGFSLGKADILRKAMGKKEMATMEKQKEEFIEGAATKDIDREKAIKIFDLMMEFAKYGFNRSHSAAYSVLAYRTAYLKAHYPAEFMAAILTHNLSDISKITFFIEECSRINIKVAGPDINESEMKFNVNAAGEIRFGLAAIKGIGEAAVENIIEERNSNGPYLNLFDLVRRVNLRTVNRKSLEALAMAGAFDRFEGLHRAIFFHKEGNDETTFLEKVIRFASNIQSRLKESQNDLFGESGQTSIADPGLPVCPPWSKLEQLKMEKIVTGFYISGHPLDDYKLEIEQFTNTDLSRLNNDLPHFRGKEVRFAGMVTSIAHKTTKTGKAFGSFNLEDYNGNLSLALFSEDYLRLKHFLNEGAFLFVKGRVESRYNMPDSLEIKVTQITLLAEVLEKFVHEITLVANVQDVDEDFVKKLKSTLLSSKGKCHLKMILKDADENFQVNFTSKSMKIDSNALVRKLQEFPQLGYQLN
jgi:DNA polymerase-3 subunit alpha